ncbi:MAG UNVERIFIED_CONTAM: hypothetical protein LVQ98_06160 [Rickettsiaceae bacterium]|jgi:primosomal protein N'
MDGKTPIIYSQEQQVAAKDLETSYAKKSFQCKTLGGTPGSGKTTLGLAALNEALVKNAQEDQIIEAYYITMDPNLVEASRKKFKENTYDTDSDTDSDSSDSGDDLADAASAYSVDDLGDAACAPSEAKFLSYFQLIEQKIYELKRDNFLTGDFQFLSNVKDQNFSHAGLVIY